MKKRMVMLAVSLSIVPGIVRAATYIYDSGTNEVASLLGSLAQGDEVKILNAGTRVISTASDDLVSKNDVSILIDGGWLEETATQAGRAGGLCNSLGVTGLSLDIVNGGTYHVTTPNRGFFKLGGTGSNIRVEGGSLLLSDITEYNWGSGFGNAKDCTIALTNATMTAFVFRFGLDSKKATGCRLLVHDSTAQATGYCNTFNVLVQRMLRFPDPPKTVCLWGFSLNRKSLLVDVQRVKGVAIANG